MREYDHWFGHGQYGHTQYSHARWSDHFVGLRGIIDRDHHGQRRTRSR
jgi:hypothetical protein